MPPFRFQPDFSFINLAPVWCYRSPPFGGDSSPYLLPLCLPGSAVVPPRLSCAVIILVLVRFALGAGEATMYPGTSQFVERWFPMRERGRANGIIFGGVGVGSGLTPPIVTAIVVHYGWRASFWFSAVVGVIAGAVWYLVARDTPEQHHLVRDSELDLILKERDSAPDTTSGGRLPTVKRAVPWAQIFGSKET